MSDHSRDVAQTRDAAAANETRDASPAAFDSSPTAKAEQFGLKIEGYRITGVLGQGGMGVVYRAVQAKLNRAVALKVLPAMIGRASPAAVSRFRHEAKAAARLHHTNIVPIYDFGESHDAYYYAMELIEGKPVNELLPVFAQSRISTASPGKVNDIIRQASAGVSAPQARPDTASGTRMDTAIGAHSSTGRGRAYYQQVARWMADAADALAYAHAEGIVHRDIKPANLILSTDGRIMIADFGLAKSSDEASVTVTGALLGTIRYLSPEQAMAKRIPVDHRTDIYSLGATMYELLTFQPAYPGNDEKQVLAAIITKDPTAARKVHRFVPPELETICQKAMEKALDARYETARALAEDLERYLHDIPIVARRPGPVQRIRKFVKRNKAATVAGFAAVLLLGAGLTIYSIEKSRTAQRVQTLMADALLQERENNWTEATRIYRQALGVDWDNPEIMGNLARTLQEEFDRTPAADERLIDEALRYCDEAIRLKSSAPNLVNVYGVLLTMRGRYSEAEKVFRDEILKHAEDPRTTSVLWLNVAGVKFLDGDFDAARDNLKNTAKGTHRCHGQRELAMLEYYLDEPTARDTIEAAIECGARGHPFFPLVRARMRLAGGKPDEMILARAEAESADSLAAGRDPRVKRYLALALLKNGEADKALRAAMKAKEMGDLPVYVELLIAAAHRQLGNAEAAEATLESAEAVWPEELKEPGAKKRSRYQGMLWFESADELLYLQQLARKQPD